ncbi:c-type cytochrome domain-containing protein [Planctellipticum variicoloris]|jgi:mono/diheme cytochrome c family protein|uniref:c-type cytochrome domain-containing protein n=1 Tax=Planctellipticum variicoloris TaxID=3064265 RepID=UPI003014080A|nr:c-type cytochrome [Planctomycetaceae bacterium SH412]
MRLTTPCHRFLGLALALTVPFAASARADDLPPPAKRKIEFSKDIQPLFAKHCVDCHGEQKKESGLRLDNRDEALNGGDSGPPWIEGKSADSLLIKYVGGLDPDVVMPPKGDRLTRTQIGLLRAWIDQGADWPKPKKSHRISR